MKKRLGPLYLIGFALLAIGGYWWWIGPDKRADYFISAADYAGRQNRKSLEAALLVRAAEANPDNTKAMEALFRASELRNQLGQIDTAQKLVWQILEKYCSSPPQGTGAQEDGEGLCQTALSRVIDYEQARLGKEVKFGSKEEIASLEKIYTGDGPEDIRALAGNTLITTKYFNALAQHKGSPKYKTFSRSPEKVNLHKEFADQYVALADEFPKSYWASRALASACGHYYHAGEKEAAMRTADRLLREFPDSPATQETRQDQVLQDWLNAKR